MRVNARPVYVMSEMNLLAYRIISLSRDSMVRVFLGGFVGGRGGLVWAAGSCSPITSPKSSPNPKHTLTQALSTFAMEAPDADKV